MKRFVRQEVFDSMQSYLSSEITGTGGIIKQAPEDFQVTELPAYEPCGSGEHLYLTIEKKGITTLEAVSRIAKKLRLPEREIGYAGMKDSVGVTRQTLSVQRVKPEDVSRLTFDGLKVLAAVRHTNKLKLGHLKGNHFRIVIREVFADALQNALAVISLLARRGVPNRFGYQRYGVQGNSHLIGAAMLRRDWKEAVDHLIGLPDMVRDEEWRNAIIAYQQGDIPAALRLMPGHCRGEREILQRLVGRPDAWEKAFQALQPRMKKLYLSACQSHMFDKTVELRLKEIDLIRQGDLAYKHINGSCFLVEDVEAEALRAGKFEISATGPMFGSKMKQPGGETLVMEERILAEEGIRPEDFDLGNGLRLEGERRPLRVPLGDHHVSIDGSNIIVEFSLPRGSYATSVVREITKNF